MLAGQMQQSAVHLARTNFAQKRVLPAHALPLLRSHSADVGGIFAPVQVEQVDFEAVHVDAQLKGVAQPAQHPVDDEGLGGEDGTEKGTFGGGKLNWEV